ncbi:helix-turn-helix domain-containing protein [Roseomonas sp. NAR14]|uniref:Helix-turn-helix domain-containing protein n=1 Tax=Roseomonas acroporae TaxID=2937791 RepID=A0A9X2BYQ6_9PROT|nr:helix-turn-helix domain-containing protein [Roseomonas acroporae]
MIFSTEAVESNRRLDLWRCKYDSFNEITPVEDSGRDFLGRNEIWQIGAMALSRNTAPALICTRTRQHIRRDSIDHWVIRVSRSGRSRHRTDTACFVNRPGIPFLISLGEPYDSDRTEADWLSLYIPRDFFPELSAGLTTLPTGGLDMPGAPLLADYLLLLERRMRVATAEQVPILAAATRSMVTTCLLTDVMPQAITPENAALAQFERLRQIIRRHIGSTMLDARRLCRLAGISRSNLYRLFEPHGGVAHYIQGMRLRMALAQLSDPACRTPIAAIGEQVGFADASTFGRAFRREFGFTPGEARTTGLSGRQMMPGKALANPAAADFGVLLRRLGIG